MIVGGIDFAQYLHDLSFLEADVLKPVADFSDTVAKLATEGYHLKGCKLPWSKTHETTRIGDGKLTIWAGPSGSGKSTMVGQVMTGLMQLYDRRVAIASFEMRPEETIYRMVCQSATCRASAEYSREWVNHFAGKLWIYDVLDTGDWQRVLGMCHYAARELGCTDVVIDSLTKITGYRRDDYAAQADFINRLQWCAKTLNVHVHLVCHMRKSEKSGKQDIRGASEITDLADNCYIITANEAKIRHMEDVAIGAPQDPELMAEFCAFLEVAKNRDNGALAKFGLYFHKPSGQFTAVQGKTMPALEVRREMAA